MSDMQGGENSGLFAALKNIAATLLVSGKTRLELLGNEIEEEKLRAMQLLQRISWSRLQILPPKNPTPGPRPSLPG